jgi:nicotinate-nucleotide adenylyltransferase
MTDAGGPVGFLGGAFDPVHIGHLRGAMAVRDCLDLERVDLIPAAQSPLKDSASLSASHRAEMLRLAVAAVPGLEVDPLELDRPGPSYTIDTLKSLRLEYGAERTLVWIVGSDVLATLPRWSQWQRLLDFAHLAVMDRPGTLPPAAEVSSWMAHHKVDQTALLSRPAGGVISLHQPLLDIASSDIRAMISAGRDPRFLLPDTVMEYIGQHGLFGFNNT